MMRQLFAQAAPADGMTTEAWIFMGAIWAVILGNVIYCFTKLLSSERRLDGGE